MPAIQPARLRQQAAALAEHFDDPPAYLRSLHYLLDFYADRARRQGQSGAPGPLTTAYNVRMPVLRMILQELAPLAQAQPEKGLALCDALWGELYLEMRLLAAMLLGQMPLEPPGPVIERVEAWIQPELELHLIEAVLSDALERARREQPQVVIILLQDWLEGPGSFEQQLGLRALLPLIDDPVFENLPVFFRLIQPLCRLAPSGLRPDILDVLAALAHRSPPETAYFLRQLLNMPDSPAAPWMVRQSLAEFPEEYQDSLREAARIAEPRPREKGLKP